MPSADDKPRRGGLERSLLYAGSFSFAANTWGRMSAGTFCPNKQKVLKRNVQNKQMKKMDFVHFREFRSGTPDASSIITNS